MVRNHVYRYLATSLDTLGGQYQLVSQDCQLFFHAEVLLESAVRTSRQLERCIVGPQVLLQRSRLRRRFNYDECFSL